MSTTPRHETGQTMVISILFLIVLLGFCALLIDGGSWMWSKRSLQGDADAAALAAAREMPESPGNAVATAENYVEVQNAADQAELDAAITNSNDMSVVVTVSRDATSSPFGKLLGVDGTEINARAKARMGQVSSIDGLLPFAAIENTLTMTVPPTPEQITVSPGGVQTGHIGTIAPVIEAPDCDDGTANNAGELQDVIVAWHGNGSGRTACGTEVGTNINTAVGVRPIRVTNGLVTRLGPDGIHADRFADVFSWDPVANRYVLEKPASPRIGFIPIISTGNPGDDDWSDIPGVSTPVRVVDYVMVYIGKLGTTGEPAFTPGRGANIEVWVTPMFGMVTPNFSYSMRSTWNPNSLSPTALTLVE